MTVLEKIKRCVSLVWDFQEFYGEEDIEEFCRNELHTYPQHDEIMEYFKHIEELEKENAELKKNYEDSLVVCGVLKNKVELLAQPSPLESMQDVLIATQKAQNEKQSDQLTKAKENGEQLEQAKTFLKELINIINYLNEDEYEKEDFPIVHKAEQFLKEIEK